ncbi:MAG: KdsC family phosphatase [Cyclobacteriaceae bacterium]
MFKSKKLFQKGNSSVKTISTVIFDVDGVMTDGGLFVLPDGEHMRQFNVKDGWGIRALLNEGFNVAVISAGAGEGMKKRLEYLGIPDIHLGAKNKLTVFTDYCKKKKIDPSSVAYMGDDYPDLSVLKEVGLACCPADAVEEVQEICHFIAKKGGGKGAVREIAKYIIQAKK